MVIKHIVLSGGGASGFSIYGILRYLSQKNFWKLSDIKTIYGTSIGAYMAVVFSLGYEWTWLDDYFEKRPWEKTVDIGINEFLNLYEKKGLLDFKFVENALSPLITAKGLSKFCTFEELYNHTKIDIHLFTVDINSEDLKTINLSYKTHPKLQVFKAVYMSMSFPLLLEPLCEDEHCYLDGGIIDNYPLQFCLDETKCNEDEILGIRNDWNDYIESLKVTNNSTLMQYLITIISKLHLQVSTEPKQLDIKNTIILKKNKKINFTDWISILKNKELRTSLIEEGKQTAIEFLNNV